MPIFGCVPTPFLLGLHPCFYLTVKKSDFSQLTIEVHATWVTQSLMRAISDVHVGRI